ncbi:MAG: hypothetical protein IH950_13100 [Bacteroidetes bacterium]|nr:hypothetical protein [Bacteroidota bacterium]
MQKEKINMNRKLANTEQIEEWMTDMGMTGEDIVDFFSACREIAEETEQSKLYIQNQEYKKLLVKKVRPKTD